MKGLGKTKIFRLGDGDDLQVEAWAPIEGGGDYRRIRFRAAQVDYVYEIDDKLSGLSLANGIAIPVALPFDDLKARIFEPETSAAPVVDLTAVTGKAAGEVQALRLSKAFNPAAGRREGEEAPGIRITLFAHRKRNDMSFRHFTVSDSDIDYFEPHTDRKDTETFVKLKRSIDGWDDFYTAIPIHHFTAWLKSARENGSTTLDLSEHTRPKSTSGLKIG